MEAAMFAREATPLLQWFPPPPKRLMSFLLLSDQLHRTEDCVNVGVRMKRKEKRQRERHELIFSYPTRLIRQPRRSPEVNPTSTARGGSYQQKIVETGKIRGWEI